MKINSALAYVGHNSRDDRNKDDFYPTPRETVVSLLKKQTFDGDIWECACGDGAISTVLEDYNYKVYSSDLVDRGYVIPNVPKVLTPPQKVDAVPKPSIYYIISTSTTLHINLYFILINKTINISIRVQWVCPRY